MDSKAVSPLIGFVLLLAIIMGFIGIVQSRWVPEWNKAVEAEHLSKLESEISEIPKIMFISATTGKQGTVSIDAGCEYPSRGFLINPPTASTTVTAVPLRIEVEFNETMPNGSIFHYSPVNYTTYAIVVQPNYFYTQRPEIVIEHSAIIETSGGSAINISSPISFAKNKVHLFIVNATFSSISANRLLNLQFNPVSYGGDVFVKNATITVKVLNETFDWWNKTLKDIFGAGNVTADKSSKKITIELSNTTLSMSYLIAQVLSGGSVKVSERVEPYRVVPLSNNTLSMLESEQREVSVKVLDIYNNPVRRYPYINSSVVSGSDKCRIVSSSPQTDEEGKFKATVEALDTGNCKIEFLLYKINSQYNKTTYSITVSTLSGGGGGGFSAYFSPAAKGLVNIYHGPIDGFISSSSPPAESLSDLISDVSWDQYSNDDVELAAYNDGYYSWWTGYVNYLEETQNNAKSTQNSQRNHASQLFEFNVGDVQISSLKVLWNGIAWLDVQNNQNDGVVLYVWNGSSWEYLCDTTSSSEVWLVCEKNGNYVYGEKVYVLVVQNNWIDTWSGNEDSQIYTDYIELDLFT